MEAQHIPGIIRAASNLSVALPLLAYVFRAGYASRQIHVIGLLIILSGLADATGFILLQSGTSTVVLLNAYYIVLFVLLSWFYYEVLAEKVHRLVLIAGS